MTRPDFDYDAAAQRWRACGHTCGCSDLCPAGETKAENAKDERGVGTLPAAIYLALPPLAIWAIYLGHYVTAAVLCYIVACVSFALLLGHWMRHDEDDDWEDDDWELHVAEALDLASLPLTEAFVAIEAPVLISETEAYLREVAK